MSKLKKSTLEVQGTSIAVLTLSGQDYISLTDIARHRNSREPFAIINNWMRGRSTIEFLGLWEKLSNPGFKPLEFGRFRNEAGTEADLLNVALFGQTAKQWRETNPELDGNMRDHTTIEQLLVLANIEGMNAEFIHMALSQGERLKRLNQIAIRQMQTLTTHSPARRLEPPKKEKE